jgi:hypothetical protein
VGGRCCCVEIRGLTAVPSESVTSMLPSVAPAGNRRGDLDIGVDREGRVDVVELDVVHYRHILPLPVIVTEVPLGPLVGLDDVIVGGAAVAREHRKTRLLALRTRRRRANERSLSAPAINPAALGCVRKYVGWSTVKSSIERVRRWPQVPLSSRKTVGIKASRYSTALLTPERLADSRGGSNQSCGPSWGSPGTTGS